MSPWTIEQGLKNSKIDLPEKLWHWPLRLLCTTPHNKIKNWIKLISTGLKRLFLSDREHRCRWGWLKDVLYNCTACLHRWFSQFFSLFFRLLNPKTRRSRYVLLCIKLRWTLLGAGLFMFYYQAVFLFAVQLFWWLILLKVFPICCFNCPSPVWETLI